MVERLGWLFGPHKVQGFCRCWQVVVGGMGWVGLGWVGLRLGVGWGWVGLRLPPPNPAPVHPDTRQVSAVERFVTAVDMLPERYHEAQVHVVSACLYTYNLYFISYKSYRQQCVTAAMECVCIVAVMVASAACACTCRVCVIVRECEHRRRVCVCVCVCVARAARGYSE